MIPIKTDEELERMRVACEKAAIVLDRMCRAVEPGMNTYDLDQFGRTVMEEIGCQSACYMYNPGRRAYPAYTCLSINDEVVHGIGTLTRVIQPGDNVSVDVVISCDGYLGDNARTVLVGEVSEEMEFLVRSTEEALYVGIEQARAGNRVGDISHAVQCYIESRKLSIVRDFVGHGIGRTMHEDPQIPNYGKRGRGERLKPGMTLCIEPMVNLGKAAVYVSGDGWTAKTRDGSPAAHFEHTILVTDGEPEILTKPPETSKK